MDSFIKKDLDSVSIDFNEVKTLDDLFLLKNKYQLIIAGVFGLLALVILYFMTLSNSFAELYALKNQEKELKQTYVSNIQKVAQLPLIEKDIQQIKQSSSELLAELPKDFSEAYIIQDLYQAGVKNGLRINVNKRLEPINKGYLIIRPYEIETTGSYEQIKRFCFEIGKLNPLVVLSNLNLVLDESITVTKPNFEQLKLKVIANTYQVE